MTQQENELNQYNYYLQNIIPQMKEWDFREKEKSVAYKTVEMLSRLQSMFRWDNLPDTIKKRDLENLLMTDGYAVVIKKDDKLYAVRGQLGGELDQNYEPVKVTVANPYLKISKEYTINKDCVVIQNDSLRMGLLPIIGKYATLMTENELSMYMASIMTRLFSIIVADDDKKLASANRFIDAVKAGDLKAGILAETSTQDKLLGTQSVGIGIETQPYGNSGSVGAIKSLIELQQYLKAQMYIDLGINSNFNMKREALNTTESNLNDDALFPLVDDMMENRKQGIENIKEIFNTELSVEFNSAWEDNQQEVDLAHGDDLKEEPAEDEPVDENPKEGEDENN